MERFAVTIESPANSSDSICEECLISAQKPFHEVAFYYKDATSVAPGTLYLYFGPKAMTSSSDTANAAKIKVNINVTQIKEDQIVDLIHTQLVFLDGF